MDIISYILSRKYTDNTVDGLGGIKGAPCTVKSVVDIDGGKRITLEWESNSGVKQTQSFDIMDGEDGANTVEWSQIQQSGTKIAEININGVSTNVYAPTGGGSGSLDAVETTSNAYALLPQADKDDPTKIYFLNDTQPSVADTPIDQSTFVSKVENQSQMNVAVTDGKLVSVYNYGSSIGACAFEPNAISATASKIKFKFTTLGSYDTAQNHAITIGVKANYQSSDWIFPTDDDWLVKKVYDTRNTSVDDYIDISGITTPCYLMICFHGWTVTFDEFLVEDISVPVGNTEIRYKDISYGDNGGGSSWIDIQGTLLAGNTSITLSNPSIKNTSDFEFFTDVFGVCPTNVSVSSGSITLTFDEQANDLGVKVRVTNPSVAVTYSYLKWQLLKTRGNPPHAGALQVSEFYMGVNGSDYSWGNATITSNMAGASEQQNITSLIDGDILTKYCTVIWGSVQTNECNITITLDGSISASDITGYSFVTGEDEPSRDPISWKLYGSSDGTNWDLIDEQTDYDVTTERRTRVNILL